MDIKERWDRLTGDRASFSMENRAFNFVSAVSLLMCIVYMVTDFVFGYYMMSAVCGVLIALLVLCYYLSRFKKQYQTGLLMYGVFGYLALILNYFDNTGVAGPTIFIFYITFTFLIGISKSKWHRVWIFFHLTIVPGLLWYEYQHPQSVPFHYANRRMHFVDIAITYAVGIVFIFAMLRYLKDYFGRERDLAKSHAESIRLQNEQILAQNAELKRLNDQKSRLFSILSHDLRGPIDSIRGYLVLLSEKLLREEERLDLETELLEQTKYTSNLLLNMLSWTKAQMQGAKVSLLPFDLKKLVDGAVEEQIGFAAKKNIKLTAVTPFSAEVMGDMDMMRIVLRNLLNNAIKFTKPGGEITAKLVRNGRNAVVSVSDNGIGIPADQQTSIFTLNTRSTFGTNNEKGIGLGLTMCREFMEGQGGSISFESEQGKGTIFHVALPLTHD